MGLNLTVQMHDFIYIHLFILYVYSRYITRKKFRTILISDKNSVRK